MTTYAVTGASGPFGHIVVEELLSRGVPASDVVAIVRTPSKVADLAERGVQVREGDYSRPETLPAALAGVQHLLLVSGSEIGQRVAQHTAVIDAAKAAGVERIAYTSILKAGNTSNPLAGEHEATEAALRASGVPATLLRNGWYFENYTSQLGQYLERGEILGATAGEKVSAAARADYAAAAAAALLADQDGDLVVHGSAAPRSPSTSRGDRQRRHRHQGGAPQRVRRGVRGHAGAGRARRRDCRVRRGPRRLDRRRRPGDRQRGPGRPPGPSRHPARRRRGRRAHRVSPTV
ncbi:NAD(P)H-binding protein [Promicromonospora soli]